MLSLIHALDCWIIGTPRVKLVYNHSSLHDIKHMYVPVDACLGLPVIIDYSPQCGELHFIFIVPPNRP